MYSAGKVAGNVRRLITVTFSPRGVGEERTHDRDAKAGTVGISSWVQCTLRTPLT